MRLTNKNIWHMYAGGCFAASDRYAYKAFTTIGNYWIQPISSKHDVANHIGYAVTFQNIFGFFPCGLYHSLTNGKQELLTLQKAYKRCHEHMTKHNGKCVTCVTA